MRPPRVHVSVRARLTAMYAGVFVAATALLLLVSYQLLAGHLRRTLTPFAAEDVLDRLAVQYLLALLGITLVAVALGWAAAGRALQPLNETLDRLRDVTDTQRRFIANASHELRGPLTVIRTEADVTLSDPQATTEDLRSMGKVVLEATDRTDALLDGLMVLARSERDLLRRDPVDLAASAQRAAAAVAPEAAARRVRVHVRGERTVVLGDDSLLDRLVVNLAENAVRHNEPGGSVEITTGDGTLAVVNSGRRVSAEDVARLTEPFERLDRASDRPGTGLGLSIVRAVAEAHGATLSIEARPEGGLDVRVDFRAAEAPDHAADSPPRASGHR
jgi:signal transduction histidine kinase